LILFKKLYYNNHKYSFVKQDQMLLELHCAFNSTQLNSTFLLAAEQLNS